MTAITTVIGRNELVDIVDHSIKDIPAKIDTGADSCAIWASNIKESKGILSFTLFGIGSVYYNGEAKTTDHYKTTSVKNSFGNSELRYTVWLPVRLNGKRYKVRFNLADRSGNHFPILLGKRFLNKKFLVDVSRNYLLTPVEKNPQAKKVLILTTNPSTEAIDFFKTVESSIDGTVDVHSYDELIYRIGEKPSVRIGKTGVDVSDYNLVYFKSRKRCLEQAMALASYLRYKNVIYRDEELDKIISHSKLSEMMELATHAISIPECIVARTSELLTLVPEINNEIRYPLVAKDVYSDRGAHNYLINDEVELRKVLQEADESCLFAVQKYIPNNGFKRVMVLGKEVTMVMNRSVVPHKNPQKAHLNKPKGSLNASLEDPAELDAGASSMCLMGAELMRRQIAGIDILQDKATGKWYILEVNSGPQLYSTKFTNEKAKLLADYFKHELERW